MIILRRKDYSGVDPISGVTYKSAQVGLDTIDKGVKIAKSNEEFLGNRTKRYIDGIDTTSRSLRKLLGKRKKKQKKFSDNTTLGAGLGVTGLTSYAAYKGTKKAEEQKARENYKESMQALRDDAAKAKDAVKQSAKDKRANIKWWNLRKGKKRAEIEAEKSTALKKIAAIQGKAEKELGKNLETRIKRAGKKSKRVALGTAALGTLASLGYSGENKNL